ncbi:Fe3+-hydroxamate ABC transporter periplasmic protein-like protein [Methanocaldococcus villosus KIN24-T80]|uniref:Fe3+-hydroxamate ABC transporter periplasmic protein-like protein n=1 Tax=Methanocaldococcus villosus KIN24-T80 TaxID=1069083 RepID=N6VPT4_9EURY|nr:Fe3+-hydroxamate ABC transporter periplasmic protein-like protein [Methanocaldococcus villosus KIN24-T80]
MNKDGYIDISDVIYLFKHRDVPLTDGDLNCDNSVDIADVVYLFRNYDKFREPVKYAKNIKIKYYDPYGHEVNPYEGDKYAYKVLIDAKDQKFVLINRSTPQTEAENYIKLAKSQYGNDVKVLYVPLKRVVIMSSTHIALMEPLNNDGSVISSVKGIMWGGGYTWYFNDIKKGLENGSIIDVGSSWNPNWDKIINLTPEAIIVYPGYSGDAIIEKCKELNLTYIADSEYLENSFLARFEWIKFFAALYNKEDVAKEYFTKVEKNALNVRRITRNGDYVLVAWGKNYPSYGGTYVPKAQSYVAKGIMEDCHADYIFKDIPGTGSACINYETFADRAKNADIWVIPSNTKWLTTFKNDHPGYKDFKAVKNGRVFCISDDYWQIGLMKTDELLYDLATIIHPELFKGRTTHFFLKYNPEDNTAKPYTAN